MSSINTMDIFNEVVGRHMGGQLIPVTRFGSTMQTFTPQWVVKDMIALLPDQVWNEHTTFLDISCKTGIFLVEIFKKLDEVLSKNPKYADTATRRSHILNEQLYGLALDDKECLWYSSRNVYGRIGAKNMKYLHAGGYSYDQLVKNKKIEYMKALIQEEFGRNMFDVVVGNPPYNNDIYLDFVTLAKAIQTQNVCMITPAKWQAKGGPKNEAFRKEIVPYMSKIVYYLDATELFNIAEVDGISFYLIGSSICKEKNIINICGKNTKFNTARVRPVGGVLNNYVYEVIQKMNGNVLAINTKNDHFKLSRISSGTIDVYSAGKVIDCCDIKDIHQNANDINRYKVVSNEMFGYSFFFDDSGKMIGSPGYRVLGKNTVCSKHYVVYRAFDDENEAKSFTSYLNTKLIRFITALALTGTTTSKSEFWRFVPDPGVFDHIFTDQELYKKYNLTDDEINIIESVIKERK